LSNRIVSVTIDIEDWYHIPSVSGSSFSKYKDTDDFFSKWEGRYDYLTEPTLHTLDMLDEFGIRATFFIVAEIVNRYPGLVKAIDAKGHEIASHGYNHRCYIDSMYRMPLHSKKFFLNQMKLAKSLLKMETSQNIHGFRTPAGYVAGWMLDAIESLGFTYDSSVSSNSLYNKTDSRLRTVKRTPYYPRKGELEQGPPRRLIEMPFPYLKLGPIRIPSAGGPFLRFFGSRFILSGINQTLQEGPTFLYFHPLDISREKFPQSFSKNRPLYWSIKGEVIEKRIRWILSKLDAKFVPMKDLERYSRRQSKVRFSLT
jgi:hypothetical protein